MRDWSRESWHKVFPRDAGGWAALSFDARGLYRLLQDEASRDGIVETGQDRLGYLMLAYRLTQERARAALAELVKARLVLTTPQDALELPIHAEQQGTITNSSERVRRFREKSRNDETLHVTPDVSLERKERKKETNKEREKEIARAREDAAAANSDRDPKSLAIEEALRSSPRFASLDASSLSDALLGSLGTLGVRLTPEHAQSAVSLAALELEDGANERRVRQVLGWKLKDAVDPTKAKKHPVQVQGQGEDLDRFLDNINNGRPAWA